MNIPTRILGFIAVLAATFGIALAAGAQVGPLGEPTDAHRGSEHPPDAHQAASSDPKPPGELMTAENGYRLALRNTHAAAGKAQPIKFVIEGPGGMAVTDYEVEHEKKLHLIVVRRDFTGFQHVHPVLAADGSLAGDLTAGEHSILMLSVAKDGKPVTDLEPYLGAFGHLVALREGDLAYLHVHPGGEPGDGKTTPGPDIEFGAEVPGSGGYHLYLDFKHDGVVRTAQFKVPA